jgi:glycosyltransferase involved in cell wall biosynthesis
MKQISVIMPALNEEKAVEKAVESVIAAFDKFSIDGEIVVVNDGSSDETQNIVEHLTKDHPEKVILFSHTKPMGIGRSFLDGVIVADGMGVLMVPGDNENDPEQILKYAHLLEKTDVVCPYVTNKEVRSNSRNIISTLFTKLINMTFRTKFKYTNGTVIYKREIFDKIHSSSSGFFFQADLLVKIEKSGYKIMQIPCLLSTREGGVSKALTFSSLMNVVKDYFKLIGYVYFRIGR